MSKPAAIVLLVVLVLLLFVIIKVMLPSIRLFLKRMPKGIFVLLFVLILGVSTYLVHYIFFGQTGGMLGSDETKDEIKEEKPDELKVVKENCIVLSGSEVLIENEKADNKALDSYLAYRIENNIPVTIVDDYSTVALIKDIIAICEKKGVRYIIENETWLE